MIRITHKGDLSKTYRFLTNAKRADILKTLRKYGEMGVSALAEATPRRSGKTADSWGYTVSGGRGTYTLSFENYNVNKHVNIAIILQYGHGTRNGGYVQGRDYINPAIQPIFDAIAEDAWAEIVSA